MYFEGICFNELFDVFVFNLNANMSQTAIQTSQMNHPFLTNVNLLSILMSVNVDKVIASCQVHTYYYVFN